MKSIRRDERGIGAAILMLAVLVVIVIAVVAVVWFLFLGNTNTNSCPPSECPPGTKTVYVTLVATGHLYQPWFAPIVPAIDSLTAFQGSNATLPSADLFSTNANMWVDFYLIYQDGKTFKATAPAVALTANNGGNSRSVTFRNSWGVPAGTQLSFYVIAYAQATLCWPGACSIQSTTSNTYHLTAGA